MSTTKRSVLAIALAGSLGLLNYILPNRANEFVVVGTPEEVHHILYNKFDEVMPNYYFQRLKDKEGLTLISNIQHQINVDFNVPYVFSAKYDNSEGSVNNRIGTRNLIKSFIWGQLSGIYDRERAKLDKRLPDKFNGQEKLEIFKRSMEIEVLRMRGLIEGFACPIGDKAKNVQLSHLRGIDLRENVILAVREFFVDKFAYEPDLSQLRSNIGVIGRGSIYNHRLVENVASQLTNLGHKIDYAKIASGDESELTKFNNALREVQNSNPQLYERIKNSLNPLRFGKLAINIDIDAKVYGIEMLLIEKGVMPDVALEPKRKEEVRRRATEAFDYEERLIDPMLAKRRQNLPRFEAGSKGSWGYGKRNPK